MDPAKPLSLAAVRRKWRYDLGFIGLVLAGLAAQTAVAAYAFPVWWTLAPLLAFMGFMGRLTAAPLSRYFAMTHAAFLDADSRRMCPDIAKMIDDHARAARIPTPEFFLMDHGAPAACAWGSGHVRRGVGLRITLADLPPAFVSAMLAHEIAHLKDRDEGVFTVILSALRAFLVSTIAILVMGGFRLIDVVMAPPDGIIALRPLAALFVVVITFIVVTGAAETFLPRLLQQHELAADALGAVICGDPVSLICALASLEIHEGLPSAMLDRELGQVRTHPPLQDRLNALMRLALEMKKVRL